MTNLAPNFENSELEFKHIIRDTLLFIPGTYEMFSLGNGVVLVSGKTIADPVGRLMPHAIVFQKGLWTPESARTWLAEHADSFDSDAVKTIYKDLYNIDGVEIFAAGTWNGDKFTVEDLDEMAKAFSETKHKFKPFLKLGHDDKQEMLQKEGMPAAGWIANVYRKGNKLLADFVDIPKKIYDLIQKNAYRKVSSEIYWDIDIGEKNYPKMLAAVALLGAEHPAVSSLNDILSMYKNIDYNMLKSYTKGTTIPKIYHFKGAFKMEKTEDQIKLEVELQTTKATLDEITKKYESIEKAAQEKEQEITELKKFKLEQEEKLHQVQLENQVSELEKENLCMPSMKAFIVDLLDVKKTSYSIDGKDASRFECLKNVLKLAFASKVNLSENSMEGDKSKKDDEDAKHKEMKKLMDEKKLSASDAYKEVNKK